MDIPQEHIESENQEVEEYERKAEAILEETSFKEFMQDDSVCANLNNCFIDFLYGKVEPRLHKIISGIDIDTKSSFDINDDFMNDLIHIFAHHISRENIFNKQYILEHPDVAIGYIERKIQENANPTVTKRQKAIRRIHPRYMRIHQWDGETPIK
jgi:hypothetical protein